MSLSMLVQEQGHGSAAATSRAVSHILSCCVTRVTVMSIAHSVTRSRLVRYLKWHRVCQALEAAKDLRAEVHSKGQ